MALRLIDFNYAQLAATALTASSSDPAFPVNNIKNPIRSRVHRTSGNFVITSANRKINFKESGGGSELTATITTGTYTPTTLAAAIKTAMDAVGASDYTITYSTSTGLWTIVTNGAFLSILWLTGTDTANSVGATLGFDVTADDTGALTYTGSNIAIHTEESIVFDLGTTEAIDTVALLFDLVNGNKLSDDAVVTIQANATNAWSSPSVSQALSIDDTYGIATHFFSSDQSYRYWRLKIVDPENPYLYIETSKVILGKGVTLDSGPGRGFVEKKRDQSAIQETSFGHRYADIYPIRRGLEFQYPGLTASDTALLEAAFRQNGSVTPIAVAFDPTGTLFDKDRFFIYGYFQNSLDITHLSGANFTVPLSIQEAV